MKTKHLANLEDYIKLLLQDPLSKSYYYHKYIKNMANQLLDRLAFIFDCLNYCEMNMERSIDHFDMKVKKKLEAIKADISKCEYNYSFNLSPMDQLEFEDFLEKDEKLSFVLDAPLSYSMKEALKRSLAIIRLAEHQSI